MVVYSLGIQTASTDAGAVAFEITSTEEEKKKVTFLEYWDIGLLNDIFLTVWLEREKIVDNIPLNLLAGATPVRRIDLDVDIPIGETLTAKLTPQTLGQNATMSGMVYYNIE